MKTKDIKNNLKNAVFKLRKDDTFEKISQSLPPADEKARIKMNANVKRNSFSFKKIAAVAVAACLLIAVSVTGFGYYGNNIAADSVIDIDVNPSIELTTNKKDTIIKALPLNDDGKKVLSDMELKGTHINIGVNAIIGSMLKNGYINSDTKDILLTVQNGDKSKADRLREEILTDIGETLKVNKSNTNVINQTVTEKPKAQEFAEKNNISLGKASFILSVAAVDSSLKPEELADKSIKEIAEIAVAKGIDDDDIHLDGKIEEIYDDVEDKAEQENNNAVTTPSKAESSASKTDIISTDKAKEIALNHANVKKADAKQLKAEYDIDDGVKLYEVEFDSGKYEYDYEINAVTGKIIKSHKELDDDYNNNNVSTPVNNSVSSVVSKVSTQLISADRAKEIALNHAGVKKADAKLLKAEYDVDDGVKKYEVEFNSGKYEYDYEINAESGKIIKNHKELDDDYTDKGGVTSSQEAPELLTAEQAKSAALKHAGISYDKAKFENAELDEDDGIAKYEISFKVGNVEYDYEINAKTGAVINFEKEIDG